MEHRSRAKAGAGGKLPQQPVRSSADTGLCLTRLSKTSSAARESTIRHANCEEDGGRGGRCHRAQRWDVAGDATAHRHVRGCGGRCLCAQTRGRGREGRCRCTQTRGRGRGGRCRCAQPRETHMAMPQGTNTWQGSRREMSLRTDTGQGTRREMPLRTNTGQGMRREMLLRTDTGDAYGDAAAHRHVAGVAE